MSRSNFRPQYKVLRVEGHLAVEIDGHPAEIVAQGNQLQIVLQNEGALLGLLNSGSASKQTAKLLADLGLTMVVSDTVGVFVNGVISNRVFPH